MIFRSIIWFCPRAVTTLISTWASPILLTLLACTLPTAITDGTLLYSMQSKKRSSQNPKEDCGPHIADVDGKKRCRFKGVVPQKNGHWGAQIYADHQRIWLGTFKTEVEAAKAYDRAAIKLRSDSWHRNICPSPLEESLEAEFQRELSVEDVVGMIKDGSYQASLLSRYESDGMEEDPRGLKKVKLFEKRLTPSDVGKLNRLVIPKKCAMRFCERLAEIGWAKGEEMAVGFVDGEGVRWEFRFCYWRSSQSFVFTRGWSRFVKGKRLKVGDVVVFHLFVVKGKPQFSIEVRVESFKGKEKGKGKCLRLFGTDIYC